MTGVYLAIALFSSAAVAVGGYLFVRAARRRRVQEGISFVLLLVRLQKEQRSSNSGNAAASTDFKTEIVRTEQLLSGLLALKKTFCLELAVPHVGDEISFYLAVPRRMVDVAIRQIQSLWPTGSISPVRDDYNIFNPEGATTGAYLMQNEHYSLPLRTYQEIGSDTFSAISGAFSRINELGEGASMQILVRPVGKNPRRVITRYLSDLRGGMELKRVVRREQLLRFSRFKEIFSPANPSTGAPGAAGAGANQMPKIIVDEDAVKAIESKGSKPLFSVNVRILASAPSPHQASDILDGIVSGFEQFGAPRRNQLRAVRPRNLRELSYDFSFRVFEPAQSMILNSEEIASFFHLPISTSDTPKIKWLKSKEAPPAPNVPSVGTRLGINVFRGVEKPIYLSDADRARHVYVIGQTGTGKTTFMNDMVLEDIHAGKGFAVIDPHGEFVQQILGAIPDSRRDDVVYFDPADLWRPIGLNMLEYNFNRPEEKTFIVNEMMSIFSKLFPPETLGPMFEQYMRNALLLLMEDAPNEPATLMEIPRVFTDSAFRTRKVERIKNPVVIDFWSKEANKVGGEASLANMTPYITSKFNNFTANDYIRPIIGQRTSAFNFRDVMDQGKILLVNLSKGKIGDINANLLGMICTGKILMAALSRADLEARERRVFNLYIDEFQNFTTDSISVILSEARKYQLTLTVAHQFIAQLTEKVRDSIFGNVGTQVVFRVGAQDAEFLVKQFDPVFSQADLMNIDNLNAYVKLLINGETAKPFNLKVEGRSWAAYNPDRIAALKEYCRMKYGADRQEVEADIFKRLRE